MRSFLASLRSLTLPEGATTGARIVLDGDTGRIEVYDANDDLVMYIDGTDGIMVPVPGDPASFTQVWRDSNTPEFRVETPDGYISINAGANEPELHLRSNFLGDTFRIFTSSNGLAFASTDNDTASFGLVHGHGFYLATAGTSPFGHEILYDEQAGYLRVGQVAPWAPEAWTDVALAAGWTNAGGAFPNVGYKRMPDGTVIFRGAMLPGAVADGTVVFNLPSAVYRPDSDQILLVNSVGSGAQSRIRVQTNGNVDIFGCAASAGIRLSGIRFPLF